MVEGESRGWRHIWGGEEDGYTTDRERGWKTKERKVGITCWNNVRVFDLKHVTEPHWNQIRGARTLNWLGVRSLLREYLNFLVVEKAIRFSHFQLFWYNKYSGDNVANWVSYLGFFWYLLVFMNKFLIIVSWRFICYWWKTDKLIGKRINKY